MTREPPLSQRGNSNCTSEVSVKIAQMKKDTRLTFRVASNVKKDIETIAAREGQSVARICEAFIVAGFDSYRKQGTKFLQPILGRLGTRRETEN